LPIFASFFTLCLEPTKVLNVEPVNQRFFLLKIIQKTSHFSWNLDYSRYFLYSLFQKLGTAFYHYKKLLCISACIEPAEVLKFLSFFLCRWWGNFDWVF